ncbi:DUF4249 domain-containing protein [Chitinophaga eiseniae]|uniref:DUF4249 domain-containing protein n=1 Tax=Chitinophaga eiseniae TaxID=634771 RepID=A0A847SQJ0_9BACT|nr:DUF4249 domain-containing protein [Chitinophaga eiseniae]NLR81247.1 DUF4249 domain-containing protein [Chitinophaga eiseniae]
MKKSLLFILSAVVAGLTACEDKIDLNIAKGTSYPVLDAWITTETGQQNIRFTMSVPYTDDNPAPIIDDATITLTDLTTGTSYPFVFKDKMYSYDATSKPIGVVGHAYKLHIQYKNETFDAYDSIKRVPQIDSITYEFKKKEEALSGKEGYYAKFYAKDLAGGTDYYWIRSYRNDTLKRLEDNFSVDGSFDDGVADGIPFILPLQEGITDYKKPFLANEKVIVRLSSLTYASYEFLKQVNDQVNAGGLFAKVLENVKSNVENTTANGKVRILGRFGTSAVSKAEKTIIK